MRKRHGDWRDLLHVFSMSVGGKVWLGFLGVGATLIVVFVAATVYEHLSGPQVGLAPRCEFGYLGEWASRENAFLRVARGEGVEALYRARRSTGLPLPALAGTGLGALEPIVPLLNPLRGGMMHLLLSVLFYVALIRVWTYFGGAISRLAALQYARDEMPTSSQAQAFVRRRRRTYFFTPVTPLVCLLFGILINALIGLVGSIPAVGPWLMVPGYLMGAVVTVFVAFLVVVGLLSLGLMVPVVSVNGEGYAGSWSAAYSYAMWGLGRLIVYSALAGALGLLAVAGAGLLADAFVAMLLRSVSLGLVGGGSELAAYAALAVQRVPQSALVDYAPGMGPCAAVTALSIVGFLAHGLALGYAASYFFTANTVICLLLRKSVDGVDVGEIVLDEPEPEEETAEPAQEQPEAPEDTPQDEPDEERA